MGVCIERMQVALKKTLIYLIRKMFHDIILYLSLLDNEEQILFNYYKDDPKEKNILVPEYLINLTLQMLGFAGSEFDTVFNEVFSEIAMLVTTKTLTYGTLCASKKKKKEIEPIDLSHYLDMAFGIYFPVESC